MRGHHRLDGKETSRRQVVAGIFAALMALLPWGAEIHRKLRTALRSIFGDFTAAQAVGRATLPGHSVPQESVQWLTRVLIVATCQGSQAVRREMASLRDREWRSDGIVIVAGWVLTRTEADLACAEA